MNRLLWLGIGILVAIALPWWLGGGELLSRLRQFPPLLLLGLFGIICLCWCVNTLRMRLLLGEHARLMGWGKSLGCVMATEFAYFATPAGSGAPLTLMAVLARNGIAPARGTAVYAMDQFNDLLFFICALAGISLYALFHNLSARQEGLLGASAAMLLGLLTACLALARYHRPVIRRLGKWAKQLRVSPAKRIRWARKLLRFVESFSETLALPTRRLVAVFALSCVHWALRYSVLYWVIKGLGGDLQWAWAFLIQMLSLSAGQFSLLPGGAGAAELTSAAMLAPLIGKSTAAAAIVIWRIVTYYFYLVAGGPVFVMLVGRPLLRRLIRSS